jgi:AraC family transcriptional regulator
MQPGAHYIGSIAGQAPLVEFSAARGGLAGARWVHPALEVDQVRPPAHVLMLHCAGSVRVERYLDGRLVANGSRLGTVGIMTAGSENRWVMKAPAEVLHLYVPSTDPSGQTLDLVDCFARDDPWLAAMMSLAHQEAASVKGCGSILLLDELERALRAHLVAHYGRGQPKATPSNRPRGGLSSHALKRTIQAMEDAPGTQWRLADLATMACVSPDHFIRAFRQSTGVTPHRYLTHLRLMQAMDLLKRKPEQPIHAIAAQCGFEREAYFATAFRNAFGLTPSEVRRRAGHQ